MAADLEASLTSNASASTPRNAPPPSGNLFQPLHAPLEITVPEEFGFGQQSSAFVRPNRPAEVGGEKGRALVGTHGNVDLNLLMHMSRDGGE